MTCLQQQNPLYSERKVDQAPTAPMKIILIKKLSYAQEIIILCTQGKKLFFGTLRSDIGHR